jgi:microsomal epoxide hydrolase
LPLPDSRRRIRTSDGVMLSVADYTPLHARTGAGPVPLAPGAAADVPADMPARAERGAVLFVPGWCMPAAIFHSNCLALAARCPVFALDPRGQGESEVPASGYTLERRARDLHEVIRALDIRVVVAWSLGVLEALQCVAQHAGAGLHGLMLVDNSVGEPPAPAGSDFTRRLQRDRDATLTAFVRGMFRQARDPQMLAVIDRSVRRMSLAQSLALLGHFPPREHWRQITRGFAPALAYVVTERLRGQALSLQAARPATRIEVFEGAGHALFIDAAPRFDSLLADWIDGAVRA